MDNLTEEEQLVLRQGDLKVLCTILDNPSILTASTGFLRRLLDYIDTDDDGEITKNECLAFLCCGNTDPCPLKKK